MKRFLFALLLSAFLSTVLVQAEDVCFSNGKQIPVSCSQGTITADIWEGCRYITCADSTGSFTARECDKGDYYYSTSFYELYPVNSSGASRSICFGDACITPSETYVRGSDYPVCDNNVTTPQDLHQQATRGISAMGTQQHQSTIGSSIPTTPAADFLFLVLQLMVSLRDKQRMLSILLSQDLE